MGMSAAHCQGNVREFHSVWRVVTLSNSSINSSPRGKARGSWSLPFKTDWLRPNSHQVFWQMWQQ